MTVREGGIWARDELKIGANASGRGNVTSYRLKYWGKGSENSQCYKSLGKSLGSYCIFRHMLQKWASCRLKYPQGVCWEDEIIATAGIAEENITIAVPAGHCLAAPLSFLTQKALCSAISGSHKAFLQ